MATPAPSRVRLAELYDRYDGFLLDAYGVLVDAQGPLPGARELCAELERRGLPFLVVTNDATRLPETVAARLSGFGLLVAQERVLTSGQLIAPYFAERRLAGARCVVLGPDDSRRYVEAAGGVVCRIASDGNYDALVVCSDRGYPFLEGLNATLSALYRAIDTGREIHRVVPNPDLVFPAGPGTWGFTAGAIALLFEAALDRRYPDRALRFDRLGKPHSPLFDEAVRRLGSQRLLMIGDQLETDIAGARARGLDAALLETGLSRWRGGAAADPATAPTFLLDRLG
jgi:HAD superfamily hydrolase (TIGR01459 family)